MSTQRPGAFVSRKGLFRFGTGFSRTSISSHHMVWKAAKTMRRLSILLLILVYLTAMFGCAAFRKDYTINGMKLDENAYADSGEVKTDAQTPREKSWWEKNWQFVVGAAVVALAVGLIIAEAASDSDSEPGPLGSPGPSPK